MNWHSWINSYWRILNFAIWIHSAIGVLTIINIGKILIWQSLPILRNCQIINLAKVSHYTVSWARMLWILTWECHFINLDFVCCTFLCTCTLILHAVNISPFIIVFRDYKNINNENFQICNTCPCNVTVHGKKKLGFKLLQKIINVWSWGLFLYAWAKKLL